MKLFLDEAGACEQVESENNQHSAGKTSDNTQK